MVSSKPNSMASSLEFLMIPATLASNSPTLSPNHKSSSKSPTMPLSLLKMLEKSENFNLSFKKDLGTNKMAFTLKFKNSDKKVCVQLLWPSQ